MSIRQLPAAVTATLLAGMVRAAPATAEVQHSTAVSGMTAGRFWPTAAALVGLAGVVFGCLALVRIGRRSTGNVRKSALVALGAGLTSLVLGSLFAATAAGGPGTGNGIVGAWAAMIFGLAGVVLGGLARNRSRPAGRAG